MRRIAILLLVGLTAGCTFPNISLCGNEPVALRNGGYFVAIVEPGDCDVRYTPGTWWTMNTNDVTVEVQAGQEYFLKLAITDENVETVYTGTGTTTGYASGNAALVPVPRDEALALLAETRESY